jgi:predicted transcriptional regulator
MVHLNESNKLARKTVDFIFTRPGKKGLITRFYRVAHIIFLKTLLNLPHTSNIRLNEQAKKVRYIGC